MDTSQRRQQILAILAEVCHQDADTLREDHELVADLGVDSPKALQLLVRLEEELDVELSDEEASGLNTVGDLLSSSALLG